MASRDRDGASLVLILPVAAAIQSLLLVRNVFFLPSPANAVMPAIQACIVVILLWLWRWLAGQESPGRVLQQLLPWLLIPVGLLLPVEQALTGNGMLAANLALVLVVGGALIVGGRRFAVFCSALLLGWALAVSSRPTWTLSIAEQATYVALGVAIGLAAFLLRTADRRRLEVARDEAVASATRDHLTSLWNRRGIEAILPSVIGAAHENGTGLWCLFIDIRGLKKVNDTAGHLEGDRLLAAVGRALETTESLGGIPARWGGDEFCVFGAGSAPNVQQTHQRLVRLVEESVSGGQGWDLSLGVAHENSPHGDVLDDLVRRADEDMYRRRGSVDA